MGKVVQKMNKQEAIERLKEQISAISLYVAEAKLDEEEVKNELLNIEALVVAIEAIRGQMIEWTKVEDKLPSFPGRYDVKLTKKTMDWLDTKEEITWAIYDIGKKKFYLPGGIVRYYVEVTEWRKSL